MPVFGGKLAPRARFSPEEAELEAHRVLRPPPSHVRVFSYPPRPVRAATWIQLQCLGVFLRDLGPLDARRSCPCLVVNELRERVFHRERPIWKPTVWCVRPLLASLVFSRVSLGRHGNLIALP